MAAVVQQHRRATTYQCADGQCVRVQHDTGARESVAPPRRTAGTLPPHLLNAARECRRRHTVPQVAAALGVKPSTAWGYVTDLATFDEEFAAMACQRFVSPALRAALREVDATGRLRDVMARVHHALRETPEWREEAEIYSQLRLARLACSAPQATAPLNGTAPDAGMRRFHERENLGAGTSSRTAATAASKRSRTSSAGS